MKWMEKWKEQNRGIEEGEKRKIKEHFSPFFFHLFHFPNAFVTHNM
jgi:hypothetical protein